MEKKQKRPENSVMEEYLLERIDQLEKRLEKIERLVKYIKQDAVQWLTLD